MNNPIVGKITSTALPRGRINSVAIIEEIKYKPSITIEEIMNVIAEHDNLHPIDWGIGEARELATAIYNRIIGGIK